MIFITASLREPTASHMTYKGRFRSCSRYTSHSCLRILVQFNREQLLVTRCATLSNIKIAMFTPNPQNLQTGLCQWKIPVYCCQRVSTQLQFKINIQKYNLCSNYSLPHIQQHPIPFFFLLPFIYTLKVLTATLRYFYFSRSLVLLRVAHMCNNTYITALAMYWVWCVATPGTGWTHQVQNSHPATRNSSLCAFNMDAGFEWENSQHQLENELNDRYTPENEKNEKKP
jgi:hypothetical protein